MKKTLVALAVLAASGASFAQATVSGTVAMGWKNTQDAAGNQAGGLGVDTTVINFTATEDLGGGLKATGKLGFDGTARGSNVGGGDTSIALSSSAFTATLGTTQLANYLVGGIANQSGSFNGFEGRLFNAKAVGNDWAALAVPFGPVTLSITEYEAAAGIGLGNGSGGTAGTTGSRNTQYQIAYASGPLAANAAFKAYDSSASAAAFDAAKSMTRGSVSYDFGVAKVGAGIAQSQLVNNGTETQSMLSVGVPLGALTLGAAFANRTFNGTASDFNRNGYALELGYALGKQTAVSVNYLNFQDGTAPAAYTGTNSNLFQVTLIKNF